MKFKEMKMKWLLMSDRGRSSHHQRKQSETSPPTASGGETHQQHWNYPRATTSAALNTRSPDSQCLPFPKQINILLILTLIGLVFAFIPPELDGFNNETIDLNIEFKLEKSGLTSDCDVPPSPTNNTIGVTYTPSFNLSPTGVGLAEFNKLECDFDAVLPATATIAIETNENKNKSILESGPPWGHNTQTLHPRPDPTAPRIDRNNKMGSTDTRLCEFDDIECIFDSNTGRIGSQYDVSFGMCIIIFSIF